MKRPLRRLSFPTRGQACVVHSNCDVCWVRGIVQGVLRGWVIVKRIRAVTARKRKHGRTEVLVASPVEKTYRVD